MSQVCLAGSIEAGNSIVQVLHCFHNPLKIASGYVWNFPSVICCYQRNVSHPQHPTARPNIHGPPVCTDIITTLMSLQGIWASLDERTDLFSFIVTQNQLNKPNPVSMSCECVGEFGCRKLLFPAHAQSACYTVQWLCVWRGRQKSLGDQPSFSI